MRLWHPEDLLQRQGKDRNISAGAAWMIKMEKLSGSSLGKCRGEETRNDA